MKIVVLAGGLSTERDVSLVTGSRVCAALRDKGHCALLVDLFLGTDDSFANLPVVSEYKVPDVLPDLNAMRNERGGRGEIGKNVLELCLQADIVFMALHGEIGENGKLQGLFDIMGIKYTGSPSMGSALAMHKGFAKLILDANGVTTPLGQLFNKSQIADAQSFNAFPCIVKPVSGGSSVGITRANNENELNHALEEAFAFEDEIIIERFVSGRELTCAVLDGVALPVAEVVPKGDFYDYAHKYQQGMIEEICPADIPSYYTAKVQKLAVDAYFALDLAVYARMDFILTKDGKIYCLEANTLPGLTTTSHFPEEARVAGIEYGELCEKIIEISMRKYEQ